MVIAIVASISAVAYAMLYKSDAPVAEQSLANAMWGVAYWVVFIFAICASLGMAIFLIKQAIENKARYLIILGITIVAFFVSYFLASGTDVPQTAFEKAGADYSVSKWIGAACYTVYVLFAGLIISVVYSEVSKRLK